MLPATSDAVSTERIVAMPTSVMATSTISAMISIMPRWRRGPREKPEKRWLDGVMSARAPYPVAQRNRLLEHAVAVALPVRVLGPVRVPGHVQARVEIPGRAGPGGAGPPRLGRGCVARGAGAL